MTGERWTTSWFWNRCGLGDPPGTPLNVPTEWADEIGRRIETALAPPGQTTLFLALVHERLSASDCAEFASLKYHVAPRLRFPDGVGPHGPARRVGEYVAALEASGNLGATRGPFFLYELILEGGLAVVTLRLDLIERAPAPQLGCFVPIAFERGSPRDLIRVMLFDLGSRRVVTVGEDVLTRAWHAPLAGGEMLALRASPAWVRQRTGRYATAAADDGWNDDVADDEADAPTATVA